MRDKKVGLVVKILILVIVILLGVIIYTFVIRPAISGYIVKNQVTGYNKGVEDAVFSIMQQASTCQTVPLTFDNETMNMIWVECLRQTPAQ